MLPSFRLIAATFLCSFLIAFGGLRLIATSHVAQETSGRASNQFPLQLTGADAGADMRRIDRNAPVVFDMRFGMGATGPVSVPSGLTMHAIDRAKRESGLDFPERIATPPAIEAEKIEPNAQPKPEPKIEIAALPEPAAAAADTPPPPPGPPAALAALETSSSDVESVGTTQAASTEPVVKKLAVAAKRKAVKRKAAKRARAAQAQTAQPAVVAFPDPFQR